MDYVLTVVFINKILNFAIYSEINYLESYYV